MKQFFRLHQKILISTSLLLSLILFRMIWCGSLHFAFLSWNIFLAMLPLLFSHLAQHATNKMHAFVYGALWLLFFPNASYLLTDIVHLHYRNSPVFWLDLVLLFAAGFYGVTLGLLSAFKMEFLLERYQLTYYKILFRFLLSFLCGYGMYLGRVERWNSWDLVVQPADLLQTIAFELRHPFQNKVAWELTCVFGSGLQLCYFIAGLVRRNGQIDVAFQPL